MTKIFLWIGIFLMIVGVIPWKLFAAELEAPVTPARKLQRGFLNIALSGIEFSNQLAEEKKRRENLIPQWITGSVKGVSCAGARILTGAYEMITFPLPLPRRYAPLLNPEFLWEHFPSSEAGG